MGKGAGGGVGALQHKKDDNRFHFQDLGFSEFRTDSSKQSTEPSSYFRKLVFFFCLFVFVFFFICFQDSRKFQCESQDHMNFLTCYLFSGLEKTARNSQNAIKRSLQTQKIVFRRGAWPSGTSTRALRSQQFK